MSDLIEQLGAQLGETFHVERELGRGGMSRVFLARDDQLGRRVVVKVLDANVSTDVSVERFRREILMTAGLQHPNIVSVISAGEVADRPYYVMPYVEGLSLRERLNQGELPIAEAVSLLNDIARALAFAHSRTIVHRDLKPENVLITAGAATLADFGIGKALSQAPAAPSLQSDPQLTRVGTSLGTPTYMAPEQVTADTRADHRVDLYGFGVLAYEMLTGKPPFEEASVQAMMAAHLTKAPPPLAERRTDVTSNLEDLVHRCLAKDPDHRPQTAEEILEVLEHWDSAPAQPRRGPRWRRATWLVAVPVLIVVAVGTAFVSLRGTRAAVPPNSVAVFPFANLGGDTSDAYFADGMTEELASALHDIPGLRVASRTATLRYKSADAPMQDIGRALNVATVIEGTTRRAGNRLRLTASLIDVEGGLTLWSDTYEREMEDVFAVQDELALAIVSALESHFDAGLSTRLRERGTESLAAYDSYLRGRYHFAQRGSDGLRRAVANFEEAIALDSSYADAYAGLADALALLPLYSPTPGDSVLPRALAAADRAIALDSTSSSSYASRGSLFNARWAWDEAERDFRHAIALDPDNITAIQWLGEHWLVRGRLSDAVEHLRRAVELDPLSPIINASYAGALGVAGNFDEGATYCEEALALNPDLVIGRYICGTFELYRGNYQAGAEILETALALSSELVALRGMLGYAYAMAEQPTKARAMLATIDSTNVRSGAASAIGRIHLGLGNLDDSVRWFERAVDAHDSMFSAESMASPIFTPLHTHPGFVDLLETLGLEGVIGAVM